MSHPDSMTSATSADAHREQLRLAWVRGITGNVDAKLLKASNDAGFRSYWRLWADGRNYIVMDSPPDKEDVRPWLQVHALLTHNGVRVPQVLAQNPALGFLLLEDLGHETYLHIIDATNADALFDAAVTQLLKLQLIPPPSELPDYDQALLLRELQLFDDWFLQRHLGVTLGDAERQALQHLYRILIDAASTQPQVLVHRDFMPRNLMAVDDGPAVLDFQDAVRGPVAYDPLSLFKDAFISWPQGRIEDWLRAYYARAARADIPLPTFTQFRRDIDFIGVQRHLKVLGIFARLRHRDGKSHYLEDAPRFVDYLNAVVTRYPEFAPLDRLLERHVRPVISNPTNA